MEGLITRLPEPFHQQVFEIWEDLSTEFGICKARGSTPIPHFTWHLAHSYDSQLMNCLRDFLNITPFPAITTTGLGLFHGSAPVVFLSIHSTISLLSFHTKLMEIIRPLSTDSHELYEPELWTPHITLSLEDTTPKIAGKIVERYSAARYIWEFAPDNIMHITETPQGTYTEKESIQF